MDNVLLEASEKTLVNMSATRSSMPLSGDRTIISHSGDKTKVSGLQDATKVGDSGFSTRVGIDVEKQKVIPGVEILSDGRQRYIERKGGKQISGGMASVFEAVDFKFGGTEKDPNRVVMIKKPSVKNWDDVIQFRREVRVQAAVAEEFFDHVQRIYDYYEVPGDPPQPYLVMEKNADDKGSLWDKLEKEYVEGMPIGELLRMLSQLAPVVDGMNEKKHFHRDIKPGNILVEKGIYKLTDYGISNRVRFEDQDVVVGTPRYAAPEAMRGEGYDAADGYGLAVTAYELLTKESYLKDVTRSTQPNDLINAVVNGERIPLIQRGNFLKSAKKFGMSDQQIEKFSEVFDKELSIDKSKRYESTQDFLRALVNVLGDKATEFLSKERLS